MRKQQESKGVGKREGVCREAADTQDRKGNTGAKKREVEGRRLEGEQRRGGEEGEHGMREGLQEGSEA